MLFVFSLVLDFFLPNVSFTKKQVQDAIYTSFVRFMAQRPEFPGDPSLLIRINEGNAEMCTGWLRESKRDDDVEVPSVWIDNYIKRRCPKDTSSEKKERLWKAVRVVLCCVVFECCVRVVFESHSNTRQNCF